MASKSKRSPGGSSVTAPKGRPTASRGDTSGRRSRVTPTVEWIVAFVVLAAVIVAIVLIWGDAGSSTHSGTGVDRTPGVVSEVPMTSDVVPPRADGAA